MSGNYNGGGRSWFYTGQAWRKLLGVIRAERVNEEGLTICEYCGKPIVKAYDCIGHHIIELDDENIHDASISLNPDNIQLVHHKCHNIIHDKLSYRNKKVYIVYGSPMSGKHTWVNSVKGAGDLIIDIDSIYQCVSGCDRYVKDGRLKGVVFDVRNTLLEAVKYRRGKWCNAYVIGGYPLVSERERLSKELDAELVFIDTSKEECLSRLFSLADDNARANEDTHDYILSWWDRYTPL